MTKKIKLMFDATILANGTIKDIGRSGIYFTAYQIINRLIQNDNFNISFYCNPEKQYFLSKVSEFRNIPVYPNKGFIGNMLSYMKFKKKESHLKNNRIMKIYWHYIRFFTKIFIGFISVFERKIKPFDYDIDIFFSPCEHCPNFLSAHHQIKKYTMIYDITPLLHNNLFVDNEKCWQKRLVDYMAGNLKDMYFSISENTKKDFLRFVPQLNPQNIIVTPLAAGNNFKPCSKEDTTKSLNKYGLQLDKKYVFSLCSLAPHKNLIRAVKTFVQFVEKHQINDLVFVLGGGHYNEFIDKLNAMLGKIPEGLVIKAGYIDDEDLAPLYSGAEWFVYTSQYEGFGLPPLEAMQCGCPVITSNNSSLPEVVGDAGIMIDWDSDEQHIKAYEDYYFHPELREQMRQKGLERAKQFSWDKTVDLMIKEMMK